MNDIDLEYVKDMNKLRTNHLMLNTWLLFVVIVISFAFNSYYNCQQGKEIEKLQEQVITLTESMEDKDE